MSREVVSLAFEIIAGLGGLIVIVFTILKYAKGLNNDGKEELKSQISTDAEQDKAITKLNERVNHLDSRLKSVENFQGVEVRRLENKIDNLRDVFDKRLDALSVQLFNSLKKEK